MRTIIYAIVMLSILTGCTKTEYIESTQVRYVHQTDSIAVCDSVYIHDTDTFIVAGDTIRTIHWRYRDKVVTTIETHTDTLHATDTIVATQTPQYSVWQRVKYHAFYPLAIFAAIAIAIAIVATKRTFY